jgi:hypothetical protein
VTRESVMFDFMPKSVRTVSQRIGLIFGFSVLQYILYGLVSEVIFYVAPSREVRWPLYIISFPGSIYDYLLEQYGFPNLSDAQFYLSMILWGTLWSFVLTRALTRRRAS